MTTLTMTETEFEAVERKSLLPDVALALGYRVDTRDAAAMGYRHGSVRYVLVNPDGTDATGYGHEHQANVWRGLPDYTQPSKAFALVRDFKTEITCTDGLYTVRLNPKTGKGKTFSGQAVDVIQALFLAFIEAKQS